MASGFENIPEILQYIGDLIFVTDKGGGVMDCNQQWERFLGYTRKDVVGHPLTDFWINETACKETMLWVVSDASFYVSNLETRFRKKNGGEMDISLTLSKLKNGNDKILGVIGVGRDITEKKKVEATLCSIRQELENFTYTISHDLKSPVLSIEGYTSLLLRDYHDRLDDKGRHYLERIQWNINKMGILLKDILELSRAGRIIGDMTEVDTGDILSAVLRELKPLIKDRGINIVFSNNFPSVLCDRDRMAQVFDNLLSNAIKFMGDQPEPRIEVGCQEKDECYEFFIKDNGVGIDPLYHTNVFGLFQRLEEVPAEGAGVGLTIAKRIVENHGGRIWVVSKPVQGATFYFTLPRRTK